MAGAREGDFARVVVEAVESKANFMPVNDADNWLHFGLTLGMTVIGLALTPRATARRA